MLLVLALAALQEAASYRPLAVPPAEPSSIEFRVIDQRTHAPVADAEVRWLEDPDSLGLDPSRLDAVRVDERLRGSPVLARSDARGAVRIPCWHRALLVEARSEGRWGVKGATANGLWRLRNGFCFSIEIRPDFDLDVLVIDADGAAAPGVPVCVRVSSAQSGEDHPAVRTDAHGRARLPHAGYAIADVPREQGWSASVAVGGCLQPPVERALDPDSPPKEPLILQLPPTGEVELVAIERDGSPISRLAFCALGIGSDEPDPCRGAQTGEVVVSPAESNSTVFRHVGLGLELHAWARRNPLAATLAATGRGPERAGERVRIEVRPGPELALLQGRVLDDQGRPRGGTDLAVLWIERPPRAGWDPLIPPRSGRMSWGPHTLLETRFLWTRGTTLLETDAAGVFRWDASPYEPWQGDTFLLFLENEGTASERGVALRIDKPWGSGPRQLGDLALVPAPLLAAGEVVDLEGKPVAGVRVGVERWNLEPRVLATTDADGRFELRGFALDWELELRFERPGYAIESVRSIAPGARHVRAILARAGGVRGRFAGTLDPDTRVSWKSLDGHGPRRDSQGSVVLAPDGSFTLDQVPSGRYALTIGDRRTHWQGTVVVRPGEELELGELR